MFGRPPVNYRWQGIASWVARPKPRSRSACFKKKCLTPASALTARREECIEQWSRKGTRNRLVWPRSAGDGSCPKGSEQVIIMVLITISLRQCRAKHRAPPICSPFRALAFTDFRGIVGESLIAPIDFWRSPGGSPHQSPNAPGWRSTTQGSLSMCGSRRRHQITATAERFSFGRSQKPG